MAMNNISKRIEPSKKTENLIKALSVVIVLAVTALIGIRTKLYVGEWTKQITHVIGALNTITSILLIWGLITIKQKKYELHSKIMSLAFYLGALFLICYISYHLTNKSISFVGDLRPLYLFLLITHILLSGVVVPFVLYSLYYAWTAQWDKHKKTVKYGFPIWLYVSVTGVIIYYMIQFVSTHI